MYVHRICIAVRISTQDFLNVKKSRIYFLTFESLFEWTIWNDLYF